MTNRQLPYAQALKLVRWMDTYQELNAVISSMQQRLERLRTRLTDAAEFADIPLDRTGVKVKIEDGPDGAGMIEVEWEESDGGST
jgi:hypothetical protein